jgi:hypothetical protein
VDKLIDEIATGVEGFEKLTMSNLPAMLFAI